MSDQSNPVTTLLTARNRLIDERRALAVAIALGYRRRRSDDPQTGEMRTTFVALQNTIEAFDRAIEAERAISSTLPQALQDPGSSEPLPRGPAPPLADEPGGALIATVGFGAGLDR